MSAVIPADNPKHWSVSRYIHFAALLILAAIVLAPLVYMVLTSVRTDADVTKNTASFLPQSFTWNNYSSAFNDPQNPVGRWFINSLIAVSVGTGLVLVVDSLAAYALARLDFPGRTLLFYGILGSMLIPGIVLVIPMYTEFVKVGDFASWAGLDTYVPLFIVYASGPFGVFLLRQFYLGIPKELEEAAMIDGAGKFRRWLQIILPLTRTPLLTLSILSFIYIYNDFFWPLLVTNGSNTLRTLTVGIAVVTQNQGGSIGSYGLLMAFATVGAIPTVVLFMILQRYFIASSALSGVKG